MRHLATLAAVGRTRAFRTAGIELGYAQSTVSEHIASLEAAMGVRLVERRRGRRGAELTRAGARLAAHAEEVLGQLAAARADVAAAGGDRARELRIALSREVAPELLSPLLRALHRTRPDVAVSIVEAGGVADVVARVRDARVDVGVAVRGAETAGSQAFVHEPLDVLVPRGSAPARKGRIAHMAELDGWSAVAEAGVAAGGIEDLLGAGFDRSRIVVAPTRAAAHAHVAAGTAVAFAPRTAARRLPRGVVAIPQTDLVPPRCIALWRNPARRSDDLVTLLYAIARDALVEDGRVAVLPSALARAA